MRWQKSKRGGRRAGAGRPRTDNPKVKISLRIDSDVLTRINKDAARDNETRSSIINAALAAMWGK